MRRPLMMAIGLILFGGPGTTLAGFAQSAEGPSASEPKAEELDLRPWRLSFDAGLWSSSTTKLPTVTVTDYTLTSEGGGFLGGLSLGYRVAPEWMANLRVETRLLETTEYDEGWYHDEAGRAAMIMAFSVGARYYLPPLASRSAVKPYLSAGVGPTLTLEVEDHDNHGWADPRPRGEEVRTMAAFGGHLGVGVDIQASSRLVLGADVAYHLTSDFSQRFAGHRNGSGLTFTFQFGVNLGGRMADPSSR